MVDFSIGYNKKKGKSSTQTGPWKPAQAPLGRQISRTEKFYNKGGRQYYPDQIIPDAGKDTLLGQDKIRKQAQGGNPLLPAATNRVLGRLQSKGPTEQVLPLYQQGIDGELNPENPYDRFLNFEDDPNAQKLQQSHEQRLMADLDRKFSRGGRFGSQSHQRVLTGALGESRAQLGLGLRNIALNAAQGKGQHDQTNADRRLRSGTLYQASQNADDQILAQYAGLADPLGDARFNDGRVLRGLGADIENRTRLQNLAQKEKYDFNRDEEERRLLALNNELRGFGGLGSTSDTQYQQSEFSASVGGKPSLAGFTPTQQPAQSNLVRGGAARREYNPFQNRQLQNLDPLRPSFY